MLNDGLLVFRRSAGDRLLGDNLGDTDFFSLFGETLRGDVVVRVLLFYLLTSFFALVEGRADFSFSLFWSV